MIPEEPLGAWKCSDCNVALVRVMDVDASVCPKCRKEWDNMEIKIGKAEGVSRV